MLRSLQIPQEPTPWPTRGLRRASVNSFGFGGTNSHVVLDACHFLRDHFLVGNHITRGRAPSAPLESPYSENGETTSSWSTGLTSGALPTASSAV